MALPSFVVIIFCVCGGVIVLILTSILIDCFVFPLCRRNRTGRTKKFKNTDCDDGIIFRYRQTNSNYAFYPLLLLFQ